MIRGKLFLDILYIINSSGLTLYKDLAMNKLLAIILTIFTMTTANAHELTRSEYYDSFKNYNGCFLLYDLKHEKMLSFYNPDNRCLEQIAANSTFKIPLSLMAFDQNIIRQDTIFKWDGKKRDLPDWNQNQTPASWLKYSVVWVSQELTPQLGYSKIKDYLSKFNYGNQDFSGDTGRNNGLTNAWLSSSLKISAFEQLSFLKDMLTQKLPISAIALVHTKKNLYLGKLNNGADYYGKTGSGIHFTNNQKDSLKLRDGWFVGFVENKEDRYIFVSNLTDKQAPAKADKSFGSQIMKPISLQLLNTYFDK